MIQTAVSKLKAERDVGKLKSALEKIVAQGNQAPEEARAFLAVYRKKIQERIAELEKAKE